jgi:hypothetical protein
MFAAQQRQQEKEVRSFGIRSDDIADISVHNVAAADTAASLALPPQYSSCIP